MCSTVALTYTPTISKSANLHQAKNAFAGRKNNVSFYIVKCFDNILLEISSQNKIKGLENFRKAPLAVALKSRCKLFSYRHLLGNAAEFTKL